MDGNDRKSEENRQNFLKIITIESVFKKNKRNPSKPYEKPILVGSEKVSLGKRKTKKRSFS